MGRISIFVFSVAVLFSVNSGAVSRESLAKKVVENNNLHRLLWLTSSHEVWWLNEALKLSGREPLSKHESNKLQMKVYQHTMRGMQGGFARLFTQQELQQILKAQSVPALKKTSQAFVGPDTMRVYKEVQQMMLNELSQIKAKTTQNKTKSKAN